MPDGIAVLFASNRSGMVGTFIIQVKDGVPMGEPELIKQNTGQVEPLGFAKDGSYYYGLLQRMRDLTRHRSTLRMDNIFPSPPQDNHLQKSGCWKIFFH